jgi:hypothetical protein
MLDTRWHPKRGFSRFGGRNLATHADLAYFGLLTGTATDSSQELAEFIASLIYSLRHAQQDMFDD